MKSRWRIQTHFGSARARVIPQIGLRPARTYYVVILITRIYIICLSTYIIISNSIILCTMCARTGSPDKRLFAFLPACRWGVVGRLSCDGRSGINSVCRWRLLRRRWCRNCAPLCQPRAEILRHGFSPLPRCNTITLPLPLPVCEATNPASDRNKPARFRVRTTIIHYTRVLLVLQLLRATALFVSFFFFFLLSTFHIYRAPSFS